MRFTFELQPFLNLYITWLLENACAVLPGYSYTNCENSAHSYWASKDVFGSKYGLRKISPHPTFSHFLLFGRLLR
jgi:hypothetical protein